MEIVYVAGLGNYVALEDDRVMGANVNRDALIDEVGEPSASSEGIGVFDDRAQDPSDPFLDVTDLFESSEVAEQDPLYL